MPPELSYGRTQTFTGKVKAMNSKVSEGRRIGKRAFVKVADLLFWPFSQLVRNTRNLLADQSKTCVPCFWIFLQDCKIGLCLVHCQFVTASLSSEFRELQQPVQQESAK